MTQGAKCFKIPQMYTTNQVLMTELYDSPVTFDEVAGHSTRDPYNIKCNTIL